MNEYDENTDFNQNESSEPERVEVRTVTTVHNFVNEQETPPESGGYSLASMVLGIIAVSGCCCDFLSLPCAIVGLVLGIIALVRKTGNKNFAIAGVVLCSVSIVMIIILEITGAMRAMQNAGINGYKRFF
ncbi:MAG: DUF4190 domain-containing protein [Clostridia bacterium]